MTSILTHRPYLLHLSSLVGLICLLSLAGIPPTAGFWGKLALFGGAAMPTYKV